MKLIANPIVKNKCWVINKTNGSKVGSIISSGNGDTMTIHFGNKSEQFVSLKEIGAKYDIKFTKSVKKTPQAPLDVYGYSTDAMPFNTMYDVVRRVPLFTKGAKSKSYFCAGHYMVDLKNNGQWKYMFCPKLITLQRYGYQGPFNTVKEAIDNGSV
jgi:hypothetical protein